MANVIQSPYPFFTDADGDPLEDGYIYVGIANLNPITNPQISYWDDALTIPAAMPVRTSGGYPVRGGTAARLYVATDYSILVQDKHERLVFSSLFSADMYSSALNKVVHKVATIADLRLTVPTAATWSMEVDGYYAAGDGGGGPIRYWDATSLAADNGGSVIRPTSILVGSPGRWIWMHRGPVSIAWFGTKNDVIAFDSSSAFQAAIDYCRSATSLASVFVPDDYLVYVAFPLTVYSTMTIFGNRFGGSKVVASAAMSAIFTSAATVTRLRIKNILISGNSLANYAIYHSGVGIELSHSTFQELYILGTLLGAIVWRAGYCIDVVACEIQSNSGDGININGMGTYGNKYNILRNKIYANTGIGISVFGATGVTIDGNTIEQNTTTGIYASSCGVLAITNNYFEGNAYNGQAFTTPVRAVKADIMLNGGTAVADCSKLYPCNGVSIKNNFAYVGTLITGRSFIFAISVVGLEVMNNEGALDDAALSINMWLLSKPVEHAYSTVPSLIAENNTRFLGYYVPSGAIAAGQDQRIHEWRFDTVKLRKNWLPSMADFARSYIYWGGAWARDQTALNNTNGELIFGMTSAVAVGYTDMYGIILNLATTAKDLASKYVVLSVEVYCPVYVDFGPTFGIDVVNIDGGTYKSADPWQRMSVVAKLGAAGTTYMVFGALANNVARTAYFRNPILCELGVSASDFVFEKAHPIVMKGGAAPTIGTWSVGDIVVNPAPVLGAFAAYICTTAGTPGVWQGYGSIQHDNAAAWNPGSIADGDNEVSADIALSGAALGDIVIPSAPYDLQGLTCTAYVRTAGQVRINLANNTGGAIDLANGNWRVRLLK
jgi:parallel beta-helix repeat protein